MILIATLVTVAERAESSKLGFHYGVRGTALSVAGTLGPVAGIILYSKFGLFGVLIASSLISLLLLVLLNTMRGVKVHGKGEFKVSSSWMAAFISSFLMASSFLIISTYLPPYQASLGVPHEASSAFFSARAIGGGIVRIPAGLLADRASLAITLPPILATLASLFSVKATNTTLSSLTGLLIGMAWGITSPTVLSTAGKEKQKSKSFGFFTVAWDLANLSSVSLAGLIAGNNFSIALLSSLMISSLALTSFLWLHSSLKRSSAP
jgi:hypothetical protein